jgi:hypothetical protein
VFPNFWHIELNVGEDGQQIGNAFEIRSFLELFENGHKGENVESSVVQ